MAVYTWTLQGTTPTTIQSSDIIQFAGAAFNTALFVGEYNDSTHVKSSVGNNDSAGNVPHNSKYLTANTVSLNGAASAALSSISTGNCPLKINFSHGVAVAITDHIFYAYNGALTTAAPTDVTFKAAEQGDASWTSAEGSAAALGLTNKSAATSHDFYLLISASPEAVGLKQAFTLRDELIYS